MIIERELQKRILPWLKRNEIIVITGSRQVGKTTLLKLILDGIKEKQKTYLDLEDLNILDVCNKGPDSFIKYLEYEGLSVNNKIVTALDEIQYLENPSNFLKIIHDHHPEIKLIVSGSSTLEIKQKFKDSLAGRKAVFELDTMSFLEFLKLRDEKAYHLKKKLGDITSIIRNSKIDSSIMLLQKKMMPYLCEYLTFGGYPKAVQEKNSDIKKAIITEVYSSYVKKDIKDIARVDDIYAFNKLLKLLASQAGNLLNINEVASTIGINILTAKKYLFLLENTFIIALCSPYFRNKRKEISKMPKIYFMDIGMRNAAISNFQWFEGRVDTGALFENFVFLELKKRFGTNEDLFYWRTLAKAEVDFVLNIDNELIPVEAKATELRTLAISRSLRSFIDTYKPAKAVVVNLAFAGEMKHNGCRIFFIPAYAI